jgi:glyoxylase-like metal-dependent hydrolase (beta-lactamase superfamily II)
VQKYWKESLPLRNSRTAYLVLAEGLDGVDCSLTDGQTIDWHGWEVRVVESPGHSRDHVAYTARKGKDGPLLLFCGDALAAPGKLWSPYTTDWDHWTDLGLKPTHQSLRKLANLKPTVLLPAHGEAIAQDAVGALTRTADAVEEVAFLKSFERYTKERLKDAPKYAFLAREQAESNGSKPWSQISEHLYLTGNTYVLVSRDDKAFLVMDPWDPHSAAQIPKIKVEEKLGKLEVVMFSHAHFDHYDGIYTILERDKPEVWTLDRVATPLADPYLLRAPFLDSRPVKFDKRPKDGDVLTWREYRFRFHHLPGQTEFTMGVETVIDGKKCYFTADNFFHEDQFSGTGGWMGLNRSYPLPYSESAQKVLDAAPDWVLAEHGGAFEFNAEDFRRRVQWGKECAKAADSVCISGSLRRDWDPHRIHVEPLVQMAKPGATLKATLVAGNPLDHAEKVTVVLDGRGLTDDQTWDLEVGPGGEVRKDFTLKLTDTVPAGRIPLVLRVRSGDTADGCDAFLAVDVGRDR